MGKRFLFLSAVCVLWLTASPCAQAAKDFASDIAPILQQNCVACHSSANAQGKLVLDSLDALERGGASGPVLLPGDSAASSLYNRLIIEDRTLRMPFGGKALAPELIAGIKDWIDGMETAGGVQLAETAPLDFHRDIEPIFKANCYGCHAGTKPQAQLRLDAGVAALKGGSSGKVILPGDAKSSRLVHRVRGEGGEQRMPLRQQPLTDTQIALLERWIDAGAVWPGAGQTAESDDIEIHWSYKAPKRPAPPAVSSASWARNDIDRFILARLEKEKLQPSPRAANETLIRRLSLDLTGLPPTLAEIDEFLADTRPDAYERLVDRLLASPHYGERWARPWLDWARYADSHGFEKDLPRVMWKYRDWVIEALNQNMPFSQFTIEQLAGDMLPKPSESQLIATGFNRNSMFNEEGGVDAGEAHHEVLVDRVNTTATLWLGSTLACAQCHNHKFDPFTQKEYYQFYAFFGNSLSTDRHYGDTSVKWIEQTLELPTPEQAEKREALRARIEDLETTLKTETPELAKARRTWEWEQKAVMGRWLGVSPERLESTSGSTLTAQQGETVLVSGENPPSDTYIVEGLAPLEQVTAVLIEALPDASLPRGGPGRDLYGNFVLSDFTVELNRSGRPDDWVVLPWQYATSDDGRIPLYHQMETPDNEEARREELLKPRAEMHLWTVDASREDERVSRRLVLPLSTTAKLPMQSRLRFTMMFNSPYGKQAMGRFRIAVGNEADPVYLTQVPARRRPLLAIAEAHRSEEQAKQLVESFRATTPLLADTRLALKAEQLALRELGIATAMVMEDRPGFERPSAPMRIRGSFLSPGEEVYADVPRVLPPLPANSMPNRLGLARWLVSRENPLTARVIVNRLWETYFGIGLVETSEDFGTQGALPSHPELLDWLAVEFMESGWNLKHMHKVMVMSATYQQQSSVSPQLREADPYNRLLARGPRFRMEAEMIRDMALAASGLLSRKIGGPSVYPYQPEGIWDVPYSSAKWEQSTGEDQFRRGLYTFLRRSSPYPSMATFDAPSREVCTVRRVRTNTPLQALNGLNDPAFFDAARAFAHRVVAEGGSDSRSRALFAFRLLTARELPKSQADKIVAWYHQEYARLARDAEAARRIVGGDLSTRTSAPELAAWTLVANVLLNMDEAVTKE
ncbi:MAG: PSD1 domain-containing protein [Bryobacterales bacterium]|nr:PSD1 domain-containing protein [Bryobacterales bacterium]